MKQFEGSYLENGTHNFCCDVAIVLAEFIERLEVRLEKKTDHKTTK